MNIRLEPWENLSDEQKVEKHYLIAVESADLVNATIATKSLLDGREEVQKNVDHLKIMVAKDYWTNQDLTVLEDAIVAGEEYLNG